MILAEAIFDGLYLAALAVLSWLLWRRRAGIAGGRTAAAALTLLLSGAAHLLPRLLRAVPGFAPGVWTGLGKLGAALGLTVWYLLLYSIWEKRFRTDVRDRAVFWTVWGCGILRLLLCALPGNGWLRGDGAALWTALRSAPLAGLAGAAVLLWRMTRGLNRALRPVWLLQLLAFLCYLPAVPGRVAFAAPLMAAMALCHLGTLACLLRALRQETAARP